MPNSHSYQLETLTQGALLLGNDWLVGELTKKFTDLSVQVYTSAASVPEDLDLDYLLLEGGGGEKDEELTKLIDTHSPRALLLTHHQDKLDPPHKDFVPLYFSDYFGPDFTFAPTLTRLLNSAGLGDSITLPDDGILDYSLITQKDLVEGIFHALTTPKLAPISLLTSKAPISLLSLAYLIRSSLNKDIKLKFDQPLPAQEILQPSAKLTPLSGWQSSDNLTDSLPPFIKSYTPEKSRPNPEPKQPLETDLSPVDTPTQTDTPTPRHADLPTRRHADTPTPHLSKLSALVKPAKYHIPSKQPTSKLAFVPLAQESSKFRFPRLKLPNFSLSAPKPLTIVISGLVIAFFLYFLTLIMSLTLTLLSVNSFRDQAESSDLPSKRSISSARLPAIFLEANIIALTSLPGFKSSSSLQQISTLTTLYRHGLDSILLAHDLASTSSTLLNYVLGAGEGDVLSLINQSRLQSSELYESLSLLGGSLSADPPSIIPERMHSTWQNLKLTLQTLRTSTLSAKALFATAPDLLGVGDRRKYLVLFQNNMELRPTGGFIGSFAVMSFENGKLYDMPIYDVYSADGQLKGHIEPPSELKEYLGEANWYLRDSNWDPDFPTSARRAEWFLDKTLGQVVHGTVAINVYTLASLLEALGSVTLPDYDEEITASNIFERAQYHSEVNFFPGSTQKKEFISSVADALFNQLTSLTPKQALPVAQALAKGIDEKNTLLAIDSPATNHTFSTLGWNGELRNPACPDLGGPASPGIGGNCYSDYAMLVDANLGVNKANYFLRRALELAITLDKDLTPSYLLSVSYQNTSTSSSWPAGVYKSYSRLYLPSDSVIDSVSIDGKELPESDIKLTAQHNRLVVGYLMSAPINSTTSVEVRYRRSTKLSKNSPTYSFYWQKQPGTAGDPLTIYLNHPLYLDPVVVSPQAEITAQQLEFSLTNITDRRITAKFQ